ncbi:DUF45 domain-containing protein [Candidatus Woesearchaeota archaeon]|jgi:hypothetical protein|nr:DUF45 domain-containing protein [Candidatus Woesearchaeota archaeon]MBT6520122.1 DUF45 domain-containing protein [Candidatus Woesearchaeota archaeon]MBT7366727.1 DUF45 domain-containing protein [Candidatus Woesearchaeota archaeon]
MFNKKGHLLEKAFLELYPNRSFNYTPIIQYSGRFRDYGGHIVLAFNTLTVKLSRKWYGISDEIQVGFIQELMLKLWPIKSKQVNTLYLDLYHSFVKNLHKAIPKNRTHPILESSFNRINERYFLGLAERPNLMWSNATRVFGTYDYKSDIITISKMLLNAEPVLLDYVMYHELLHKQRKFIRSGTKTIYHDKKFKRLEKVFENQEEMEHKLQKLSLLNYKQRMGNSNVVLATKPKSKSKSKTSFFSGLIESIKNL